MSTHAALAVSFLVPGSEAAAPAAGLKLVEVAPVQAPAIAGECGPSMRTLRLQGGYVALDAEGYSGRRRRPLRRGYA